jgi:hypothetical protein
LSSSSAQIWSPTRFCRFERALDTSMGTARIVTDAGQAHIKPMGNRQGPHPLACEWVATKLARWFGLATFDHAIMLLQADDEIPFHRGNRAQPGPAFCTRTETGHSWGGEAEELLQIENKNDITRLVVFDTWTRNCDRYPPDLATRHRRDDNVFLSEEGLPDGRFRLIAMDLSHCFTCGDDLSAKMANIDRIKDERVFGLFPEFISFLRRETLEDCRRDLKSFRSGIIRAAFAGIPREWNVPQSIFEPWEELVCRRAEFVADVIIDELMTIAP